MNPALHPPPATAGECQPAPALASTGRLLSLDAFRGAIMLLMASSGFGIPAVARQFSDNQAWQFLGRQCAHAEWAGCTLWDLIQPAFVFMVGVALPWSVANRRARGDGMGLMLAHALWRSCLLVLLAVFLTSAGSTRTEWAFTNVLAQIGLGYPFLFLLGFVRPRAQWIAAFGILFAYWLAFALHPLPATTFHPQTAGVAGDPTQFSGFAAHWNKNANFAATFDRWFLNLFPRAESFTSSPGGYQTLSFIPSLVTMIFGLIAGQLLRANREITDKLKRLVIAGLAGVLIGQAADMANLCPVVKRIWTPGWVMFSGGLVNLLLAGFVAVIDGLNWRRWTFPFVVAGLNPITLYCLWVLAGDFIRSNLRTHLGQHIFETFGATYAPILERVSMLLVFWLILLWMYRRKLFLRI